MRAFEWFKAKSKRAYGFIATYVNPVTLAGYTGTIASIMFSYLAWGGDGVTPTGLKVVCAAAFTIAGARLVVNGLILNEKGADREAKTVIRDLQNMNQRCENFITYLKIHKRKLNPQKFSALIHEILKSEQHVIAGSNHIFYCAQIANENFEFPTYENRLKYRALAVGQGASNALIDFGAALLPILLVNAFLINVPLLPIGVINLAIGGVIGGIGGVRGYQDFMAFFRERALHDAQRFEVELQNLKLLNFECARLINKIYATQNVPEPLPTPHAQASFNLLERLRTRQQRPPLPEPTVVIERVLTI